MDLVVREYGAAPPAEALRVVATLADALDFAAAVNICHGALHPRDVLLSTDDTRLTGIGVARALEQAGATAPVRRPYTAPERVAHASWDRRADVFSLAVLMHELLWARRVSGLGAEAAGGLTPIEGCDPAALRATFARALAENPDERFSTALEFADALMQAFPDVAVTTAPVALTTPSKRGSRMESEPRLPLSLSSGASSNRSLNDVDVDRELAPALQSFDDDVPLKSAATRYEDLEVAPVVPQRTSNEESPVAAPAGLITGHDASAASLALDRARSAVWPLVLALTVGLAMGFAGGYGVGSHDRTQSVSAGREFTENAVDPPRESTPARPEPVEGRDSPRAEAAPTQASVMTGSVATRKADTTDPQRKLETSAAAVAAAVAAPVAAGRLLIRSTPAGASVTVDGREYGKTPATIRDLARGPHHVRLAREGFVAQERRVVLSSSRPAQSVNVALVRAQVPPSRAAARPTTASARSDGSTQFAGALVVDSRPTGAKVYLDGKLIGNTPLSLQTVAAGEHAVRLERDGYRRWSSSVRIVAAENNRVTASLER